MNVTKELRVADVRIDETEGILRDIEEVESERLADELIDDPADGEDARDMDSLILDSLLLPVGQ